jgi:ABC-type multidrug transport system fused ATPase/permease subunit
MTPSEAPTTTSPYALGSAHAGRQPSLREAIGRLAPFMASERGRLALAFATTVVSSTAGLLGPLLISRVVDGPIRNGDVGGVLRWSALLLGLYVVGFGATYLQTEKMGTVGRYVLFNLRNALFAKLQALPVDFFQQNKSGDLISRINNDTEKVNQFFSQALVQLTANTFFMVGAAVFLVSLNARLGLAALGPAVFVLLVTRATGPWVKHRNAVNLQALGALSAEVQESIGNFRVIVAFNRLDYFRRQFGAANDRNYHAAVGAGLASNLFLPLYGLAQNLAQIIVLAYGFYLISAGALTVGVLIGFLLYVNSFYGPLRQLGAIWALFQLAMASLDRIAAVLSLEPNLPQLAPEAERPGPVLAFDGVQFRYPGGTETVLHDATFALEAGKTYALVGPTGGGKTTTASLMARLYDPTSGRVLLNGRDIRSVTPAERARKIGFILQEPFLFTGTIRDNLVYGHEELASLSNDELRAWLEARGLSGLLARFEEGLDTPITPAGLGVSLGQKQIVAFMRAVLRAPEILVLDEATANIDTVTEQALEEILRGLPPSTTKVVIAHRLNTIENADEIFFINAGEITPAGSMAHALEMLMHGHRAS